MQPLKETKVYIPTSVDVELPKEKGKYIVLTKGNIAFSDYFGTDRFIKYNEESNKIKNGGLEYWLKEQTGYFLTKQEMEELLRYVVWSDDWDRTIHNLLNNIEDNNFYCHDKCCANAQEDYDFKKCSIQCDKCKEI